jgi:hypothetical protein
MNNAVCNPIKKGGLFSRPKLRGKDLNLRPLGYEGKSNLNTNQENAAKPTLRK